MKFSGQEYCSGLPVSAAEDLPDSGIEPGSPAFQADTLTSGPPGKPRIHLSIQETQEMGVQSLGRECLLEEEMATHCSILAWRIPWTEEPGGLQSTGSVKSQT